MKICHKKHIFENNQRKEYMSFREIKRFMHVRSRRYQNKHHGEWTVSSNIICISSICLICEYIKEYVNILMHVIYAYIWIFFMWNYSQIKLF